MPLDSPELNECAKKMFLSLDHVLTVSEDVLAMYWSPVFAELKTKNILILLIIQTLK